jgi:adenosylcobinamide-phosphate synthase
MNRSTLLPAAYLLDQIAGDPEWLPHPVRLIGHAITHGEALLRAPDQTPQEELIAGAALSITVVASTYFLTAALIHHANRRSRALGTLTKIILGWTCLAARNLDQEATAVLNALAADDISLARQRLARIVGRDTANLDEHEISRAVIETVAESASDGIIAPLFYMALGGVPLAMAYKAVNTLDSMIGHADTRYFYFGKVAARLDDVANYLPARFTAAGIVAASHLSSQADPQAARRIWQRDGSKHKSPNAGQPESAIAGALQVRLGGNNTYAGELIPAQAIAPELHAPTPAKARQAIRLIATVSLLAVAAGFLLLTTQGRLRKSR